MGGIVFNLSSLEQYFCGFTGQVSMEEQQPLEMVNREQVILTSDWLTQTIMISDWSRQEILISDWSTQVILISDWLISDQHVPGPVRLHRHHLRCLRGCQ